MVCVHMPMYTCVYMCGCVPGGMTGASDEWIQDIPPGFRLGI